MEKDKNIEALNSLVEINYDRIEGYRKASESVEERDLKDLFSMFEQTSLTCLRELISEINKSGGIATEGTSASGRFFKAWMDFKSDLTGDDRVAILNSCVYGEENASEVYNNVLEYKAEYLSQHQKKMIESQLILLRADQRTIKSMQNHLAETA